MAYGNFKDLPKRTPSDKVLNDKALNIAKNTKYDGYQKGLASMVYKFFEKTRINSNVVSENKAGLDKSHTYLRDVLKTKI